MSAARQIDFNKDVTWVKGGEGQPYLVRVAPLDIKADPEIVWDIIKNLNFYSHLSKGLVDAKIGGATAPGQVFDIDLYKGQFAGWWFPRSRETLNVVDDAQKVLGWERKLPWGNGYSQRYQVLEKLPDNQGTRSYIALHIPGSVGFFAKKLHGKLIERAFAELHQGIKQEAESRQLQVKTPVL